MEKKIAPPVFNGEEGESYLDWKTDLECWEEFTDIPKKKRAAALLLELKDGGKVKDVVRSLGKEKLLTEDGMKLVLEQLDKIYKEDDAALTYRAYGQFEKYVRPKDMNLHTYTAQFEKMLSALKTYQVNLPEVVLAFRYLASANLPTDKVNLALATVKSLTYKDMGETVKRLCLLKKKWGDLCILGGPNDLLENSGGTYLSILQKIIYWVFFHIFE